MSFLEIFMLWELNGVKYLSVRAYYFPEDTVEGRFPEQGQVSDHTHQVSAFTNSQYNCEHLQLHTLEAVYCHPAVSISLYICRI